MSDIQRPQQIGVLLFHHVEELDAIGPWEVLAFWTRVFPEDSYDAFCVSRDGGSVQCAKGLEISAHHSAASMPPMEVFIHPGGRGARQTLIYDEEHLTWVRDLRSRVPLMTSVCTGSLVYAQAGLLNGRSATTHWSSLDRLTEIDASVDVRRGHRFVDDGDIITSAGVSAGMDMALHLVARLAGANRAKEVRRGIQYDPEPPI